MKEISRKEVGDLDYYDLLGYLGVPNIHWGGEKATEELISYLDIDRDSHVLVIGCGIGHSALHIANEYGCRVTGIDIAENMVATAKKSANKLNLTDKVQFQVTDAHEMPFEDETFDVAIAQFVMSFLDKEKAFSECARVLKKDGRLGINEPIRAEQIPQEPGDKIDNAVKEMADIVGLDMTFLTVNQWKSHYLAAGFTENGMKIAKKSTADIGKSSMMKTFGLKNLVKYTLRVIYYTLSSSKIRKKFSVAKKVEIVFSRKKETAQYVGFALVAGKKGK